MLANNLKRLRLKNNLTQEQISHKIGVTRPAYTAYEKGTRNPDSNMLSKIADVYDVSIDDLLGRKSKVIDSFDDLDALMFSDKEGFDNLSESEQEEIKEMINDQLDFLIQRKNKDK